MFSYDADIHVLLELFVQFKVKIVIFPYFHPVGAQMVLRSSKDMNPNGSSIKYQMSNDSCLKQHSNENRAIRKFGSKTCKRITNIKCSQASQPIHSDTKHRQNIRSTSHPIRLVRKGLREASLFLHIECKSRERGVEKHR